MLLPCEFRQSTTTLFVEKIVSGPMSRGWLFNAIAMFFFAVAPATVCSQTATESIVLRGSVSKTITLSLGTSATQGITELIAFASAGGLRLEAAGSGFESDLQVPLLIRANTSYKLSAEVQTQTAVLTQLRVLSVERGGKLVASDAVTGVTIERQFAIAPESSSTDQNDLLNMNISLPFTILNGPRISLGGGPKSLDNALKVVLLLSVRPKTDTYNWALHLKLEANATGTP